MKIINVIKIYRFNMFIILLSILSILLSYGACFLSINNALFLGNFFIFTIEELSFNCKHTYNYNYFRVYLQVKVLEEKKRKERV